MLVPTRCWTNLLSPCLPAPWFGERHSQQDRQEDSDPSPRTVGTLRHAASLWGRRGSQEESFRQYLREPEHDSHVCMKPKHLLAHQQCTSLLTREPALAHLPLSRLS